MLSRNYVFGRGVPVDQAVNFSSVFNKRRLLISYLVLCITELLGIWVR